jgi:type I restriction enzyme M protein
MVRLSLVNLYLHGFTDPHIVEYDTLTSEEKWNETADVILANPPFMSPKGGIKPHKRFSVQATRSEVLFVDYMAEHLSPQGRAAIVVPEGIIFQSGTAYKKLREMLVKNSLVAVVSLPAGVFNPYSGVKTSILILDKRLAKTTDSVLFVKVENDGFNLGAQRRAVMGSGLPDAVSAYLAFRHSRESGKPDAFDPAQFANAHVVEKARIGENGEWNLSGERYIETTFEHSHFSVLSIGDVCEVNPKKSELSELPAETAVSFVPMQDLAEHNISFQPKEERLLGDVLKGAYTYFRDGDVLLAKVTPCFENGKAGVARKLVNSTGFGSSEYYVLRPSERILPELVYYFLSSQRFKQYAMPTMTGTGGLQRVPRGTLEAFKIPVPPLAIQQEIVAEIESYQKIIDGAWQVVENYRPRIVIRLDWPMVKLGEIIDSLDSGVSVNSTNRTISEGEIGILKTSCVTSGVFDPNEHKAVLPDERVRVKCQPKKNSIIISRMNTENLVGANAYISEDHERLFLPDRLWQTVISRTDVHVRYLQTVLASDSYRQRISAICGGTSGSMKNISKGQFFQLDMPLPPLETQRAIVAEIEAEQALVNANKQLITRFEAKIKTAINRVWGEAE